MDSVGVETDSTALSSASIDCKRCDSEKKLTKCGDGSGSSCTWARGGKAFHGPLPGKVVESGSRT